MKFGDIIISVVIVFIILLIIIPLNSVIMDILITFNMSIALMILLLTLYIKEPLEFSVFPSLLLITTLFRLALNISSTRLILRDGFAGGVIETFGSFVIGDNIIVGFVIFLIIIIVQFIVITKGAERVAEVAARFTLDAMPGKQMAIDADLNAGLIDDIEAKKRRKDIQREADFYGSMDGASKFVKGDAVVGIIITLINIIGGAIIGSMSGDGLTIAEIFDKYTRLTVGDGLVSQLPALLISTATGIIVTRAASDSNMSQDVIKQMMSQPLVLIISGALLFIIGSIKGLPHIPIYIIAALMIYMGITLNKNIKIAETEMQQVEQKEKADEMKKPENVMSLLKVDPIELEFGYSIIPLADSRQGGDLLDRVVMIRRQCAVDMGLIVPVIRLRDNIQLDPNEYLIKIKGIEVARGEVMIDRYLAMSPGNLEEINGIDTIEPAFNLPAKWIEEKDREKAEILGYTVVDPPSVISTHLTEILKRHAHELIGRQEVSNLIDNVRETHPSLVEELVPKLLSLGEIQKVLANLLREKVPIRDIVTILETLADYAPITKDVDMLTEYVRQSLSRYITKNFIDSKTAEVITLNPAIEQQIMDNIKQTEHGSYLSMDPEITQKIIDNLAEQIERLNTLSGIPIILTSPIVRIYFKKIIEQVYPELTVLSYNEIEPGIEIKAVGMVNI
ncbi:MAG: flagellar biosynthesis protein FlhA [Clostridia bacterium]|nr:flagellar biosynthesis protein FlhA [Clostridia bacterium]